MESTELQTKIEKLQNFIDESDHIVFFGGAGVSTESGIPDFRSTDGLYNQKWDYSPEQIISRSFFETKTAEFYRFYREKLIIKGIKPNAAHYKLAALEKAGKLSTIITQNIDGLHQAAGSKNVFELHGSTLRNHCVTCGAFYDIDFIADRKNDSDGIPRCIKCGGIIKPDIVLYEESLNETCIEGALKAIRQADMLIIGGTSLTVYPAAGLIDYYKGRRLVLINKTPTYGDASADLIIRGAIGEILSNIKIK
ncbi:MAG: NAD-dependent protein deacylase [Treponema sp.]|jgi:NAD-dependent deacetylase|nr:NAD-dependent protein deacylase [Treponema sp.]